MTTWRPRRSRPHLEPIDVINPATRDDAIAATPAPPLTARDPNASGRRDGGIIRPDRPIRERRDRPLQSLEPRGGDRSDQGGPPPLPPLRPRPRREPAAPRHLDMRWFDGFRTRWSMRTFTQLFIAPA